MATPARHLTDEVIVNFRFKRAACSAAHREIEANQVRREDGAFGTDCLHWRRLFTDDVLTAFFWSWSVSSCGGRRDESFHNVATFCVAVDPLEKLAVLQSRAGLNWFSNTRS